MRAGKSAAAPAPVPQTAPVTDVPAMMHEGEIPVDLALVRNLLAAQFPEFGGLPIREVRSTGTVNAIFRIGERFSVRLPRLREWAADLDRELSFLPLLAPYLTLTVPTPVARGEPAFGYPCPWGIYEWLEGDAYADELVDDERDAAQALARFVTELRRIDVDAAAPPAGRGPLVELDAGTRASLDASAALIDTPAAIAAWEHALDAPPWTGNPVWIHSDLLRPNVLVRNGRLSAVIDFGGIGVGDPAADLIAAWAVFGPHGRQTFRDSLEVDDGTWNRARGYALTQAAGSFPTTRRRIRDSWFWPAGPLTRCSPTAARTWWSGSRRPAVTHHLLPVSPC